MARHAGSSTVGVLAGALYLAGSWSVAQAEPPNFAPNPNIGWYSFNREFIPPASGPGPVRQDPSRPHVTNDEYRVTGRQPSQPLALLDNPILQPWARDMIRKRNETVLAGKLVVGRGASCWPGGVTSFILSPMTNPMYFIQGKQDVALIKTSGNDVRYIHLADKHSPNVKISWYGESVGHYEDDSLVIDTIGLDDRTTIDGFGTPHTTQLHVIERFHLIEDGNILQADVHVEDPGAFTMPWNAIVRYRQYEAAVRQVPIERLTQLASGAEGPLREVRCADNPNSFFPGTVSLPLPQATTPDF